MVWTTEELRRRLKEPEINQLLDEYAKLYQMGKYEETVEKVLPLAEEGYAKAQNMMGLLYSKGCGVEHDVHKAYDWYMKAVKQNYMAAFINLGNLFYDYGNGDGTDQKAYSCYLAAIERTKPAVAKCALKMLQDGVVPYDRVEEIGWIQRLAMLGEEEYVKQFHEIYQARNETPEIMRELDFYVYQTEKCMLLGLAGTRSQRFFDECKAAMEEYYGRTHCTHEKMIETANSRYEIVQFPDRPSKNLGGAVLAIQLEDDEKEIRAQIDYLKQMDYPSVLVYVFDNGKEMEDYRKGEMFEEMMSQIEEILKESEQWNTKDGYSFYFDYSLISGYSKAECYWDFMAAADQFFFPKNK